MSDTVKVGKKEYVKSQDLEILADKVINDKNMGIENVAIKYLLVYPQISKTTAGRCIRANDLLKVYSDCDYVVQMSGDLWDQIDDDTKTILMWHELLHVSAIMNEKTGEWDYRLRDHDVQDFYTIIQAHGIDWFGKLKTLFSSVYDIDPTKLDGFSL